MITAFLLLLAAQAVVDAAPAAPQKRGPAKVEDLATTAARRLSRRLRTPVRIAELSYRVFQSAFVGRGLRVGPPRAPYLAAKNIRVELIGFNKRALRRLTVSGVTVQIPAEWLGRPIPTSGSASALSVGRLELRQAKLLIADKGVVGARLLGVRVDGESIAFRSLKKGKVAELRGSLRITAKSLVIGELRFKAIELKLKLGPKHLSVERLVLGLFGGQVILKGRITIAKRPRIDLRGSASLRPWGKSHPTLSGKLRVRSSGKGINVSGALKTAGGGAATSPAAGSLPGVLPLRLNLRLGRRRLTGSRRRWRLR